MSSYSRNNPFEALRGKFGDTGASARPPSSPQGPKSVLERVTVRQERTGRGGKTVTLAEGPGFAGRDLEPLAREAARALGVGTRVEAGALLVQGDQRERLVNWLAQRGFERVERGN